MESERVRANYSVSANLSPAPNNFHLPPKPPPTSLIRRIDDAEISIFDAERYFNEVDQDDTLKKKNLTRDSSVSSGDGSYGWNTYFRTRSFRASTPTASSEVSWNSQTGLLAKPRPGSVGVGAKESRKGSSSSTSTSSFRFRKFFRRHCPCYGKKSVEVEDKFSESSSSIRSHNSSNIGCNRRSASFSCQPLDYHGDVRMHVSPYNLTVGERESALRPAHPIISPYAGRQGFPKLDETMEMTKLRIRASEPGPYSLPAADIGRRIVKSDAGSFSFPVLTSPVTAPPLAKEFGEEPARESSEVFRPSVELARILMKSTSAAPIHDDDVASDSDASSDLFELESLSVHSSAPYRRRDSLDELPKFSTVTESMAPANECYYAPSEASVDWSVATAEAGFGAASEDCGEVRSARTKKEVRLDSAATPVPRNEGGAVKKRGGDGGLLNCRSEKAVSVGPDPVRFVPDLHCPL